MASVAMAIICAVVFAFQNRRLAIKDAMGAKQNSR
jgi:hypothetical protein